MIALKKRGVVRSQLSVNHSYQLSLRRANHSSSSSQSSNHIMRGVGNYRWTRRHRFKLGIWVSRERCCGIRITLRGRPSSPAWWSRWSKLQMCPIRISWKIRHWTGPSLQRPCSRPPALKVTFRLKSHGINSRTGSQSHHPPMRLRTNTERSTSASLCTRTTNFVVPCRRSYMTRKLDW